MTVTLLGVPWDERSSFQRGAALAPPAIRAALRSPAGNLCTESGLDLGTEAAFVDAGDLDVPSGNAALEAIDEGVTRALRGGARVLALGGDHAVTYPIVRAQARVHGPLTILHLDAHPDLYDAFDGDRYSHACPFARIMEDGLARRLVQVGIRAATPHQREQARRFGVETFDMASWRGVLAPDLGPSVYVSLDLDVLDPAFAPGVSHREPGGLSTREVVSILQSLRGRLVGADLVELNPVRDAGGVTAVVAAKLVKELVAGMR
jgi:agmatinase